MSIAVIIWVGGFALNRPSEMRWISLYFKYVSLTFMVQFAIFILVVETLYTHYMNNTTSQVQAYLGCHILI